MLLYYSKGSCSLSPHITAREAGIDIELVRVDLATKKTESGEDYSKLARKSAVPMIQMDNGEFLTEGAVIVQYLADQAPQANLIPKAGSIERVRVQEWLNYVSSELHRGFGPIFKPMGDEAKEFARKNLAKQFDYVSEQLANRNYLMGDQFTVADAYLYTVLTWAKPATIDLAPWPVLTAYRDRVAARPKVQEALVAEGLIAAKAAA